VQSVRGGRRSGRVPNAGNAAVDDAFVVDQQSRHAVLAVGADRAGAFGEDDLAGFPVLEVLEADRGAIEAGRTGNVADEFLVAVVPDDPQNMPLLGVSAAARVCAGPGEVHEILAGHQGQCSVHRLSISRPTDTAAQQRRAVGSLRSSIA
jgi:hypothetical protein